MEGTKSFRDILEISEAIAQLLEELGYKIATPVQEACIPLFCGHKDVAVDACTGSGKTLAFVIPIAERLHRMQEPLLKNEVAAIVISPTRELARQIFEVTTPFLAAIPWAKGLLLTGGTDVLADVAAFEGQGGNLIVATPGRLSDVMNRSKFFQTKQLEVLVLDEADRLLDMGFRSTLDQIMQRLPKQRRTGLFSATQTDAVQELARAGLRNPVRIKVAVCSASQAQQKQEGKSKSQKTPLGLRISYHICDSTQKLGHLLQFLQMNKDQKVIAFVLTCALVDFYSAALRQLPAAEGLNLRFLHGRMKQPQRQSTLDAFASQDADVAARGLDIPDVSWILQLDAPQDPDVMVHRVGRTARMGRQGNALIFLLPHEEPYIEFLKLRKVPMQQAAGLGNPHDVSSALRKLAETKREVLEKGLNAFVSYVRGYKEHQCKYIFRLQDLHLGELASACGLLRLPKMPETRKIGTQAEGFIPSSVNPDSVKFQDKARQRARDKKLRERLQKEPEGSQRQSTAAVRPKSHLQPAKRLSGAKKRVQEEKQIETDFADEYTILKKLKRGKITEEEYETATRMLNSHELNDVSDIGAQQASKLSSEPSVKSHKAAGKSTRKFKKLQARKASYGQPKGRKKSKRPRK